LEYCEQHGDYKTAWEYMRWMEKCFTGRT